MVDHHGQRQQQSQQAHALLPHGPLEPHPILEVAQLMPQLFDVVARRIWGLSHLIRLSRSKRIAGPRLPSADTE